VIFESEEDVVSRVKKSHIHEPSMDTIAHATLKSLVRMKVSYARSLGNTELAHSLIDLASCSSGLYKHKWANYPKITRSLDDLVFDNPRFAETAVGNKRFLIKDVKSTLGRIVVF